MTQNYKPFVVYATFLAKDGCYDELLRVTRQSAAVLEEQPGLLNYQILTPNKSHQPIVFVAHWKSQKHFAAAMKSEKVQAFHSGSQLQVILNLMTDTKANFYGVDTIWHTKSEPVVDKILG